MVTLGVFVCMNTLERFLLCLFSPNLYFSTKFDDYLDVHEELEHTTISTCVFTWTLTIRYTVPLTIQDNIPLDALIKYVA